MLSGIRGPESSRNSQQFTRGPHRWKERATRLRTCAECPEQRVMYALEDAAGSDLLPVLLFEAIAMVHIPEVLQPHATGATASACLGVVREQEPQIPGVEISLQSVSGSPERRRSLVPDERRSEDAALESCRLNSQAEVRLLVHEEEGFIDQADAL